MACLENLELLDISWNEWKSFDVFFIRFSEPKNRYNIRCYMKKLEILYLTEGGKKMNKSI